MAEPDYSPEIIQLCALVGFALYLFSKVEESLAALYGTVAGVSNMEIAFRTHDEIREFHYRLDATNAVVRAWIKSSKEDKTAASLSDEWNALYGILKRDSHDRNSIAHFSFAPEIGSNGTTKWYVCPYFQSFSHLSYFLQQEGEISNLPPGTRKFDAASMQSKAERFLKTAKRIDRFIGNLLSHGARLPGPP